jgi:hypothetical protein
MEFLQVIIVKEIFQEVVVEKSPKHLENGRSWVIRPKKPTNKITRGSPQALLLTGNVA